jgi:lysozyme
MKLLFAHISLLALLAGLVLGAPSVLASSIRGVDVSNHQGKIAWGEVPDRFEFAFLKASEDTDFVDSWYERNRRQASKNGKEIGAYHFGRPEGSDRRSARQDGRLEASFFLEIATPQSGDLLPVLDLEVSGGLQPGLVKQWAIGFVRRVERKLGAKTMIYTSPHFWRTAVNDTQWFARRGFKAVWIAHWETAAPDVPAENWDGRGWTFWQYTDCGTVKGIAGCVDLNKFRYERFGRVSVR